ncbi:MAG: molybdenum cofactor synthesis domain-containing protein [Bacteroidota bacterium]
MSKLNILSVNISEEKGTIKKAVDAIELTAIGVTNDAHSGKWHRQVSLLGRESIIKFEEKANRKINFGEFAENITTEGMLIYEAHPLDILKNDTITLEITQIGKHCHGDGCAIYREVGNCVMPKEGIFARVLKGGTMKAGDVLEYYPKIYKALVITLSDRASAGEYEDRSGVRIKELLEKHASKTGIMIAINHVIIPDDAGLLTFQLQQAGEDHIDFIFTTGGTGIGPRDITPETVKPLLDKEIPGIMEMIRLKYGAEKPNALLSRGVAGLMGSSLVYTLPGSVKAVNEYMEEILKTLNHLVYMQYGLDVH